MKSDVADVVGGAWLALGRCLCTLCIGKSINLDPGGEVEGGRTKVNELCAAATARCCWQDEFCDYRLLAHVNCSLMIISLITFVACGDIW